MELKSIRLYVGYRSTVDQKGDNRFTEKGHTVCLQCSWKIVSDQYYSYGWRIENYKKIRLPEIVEAISCDLCFDDIVADQGWND